MAIVVEDGTNVAGANSYVTLLEARDYASLRGLSLPSDNDEASALLVRAMDYLNTLRYRGEPVSVSQDNAWPRKGVYPCNGPVMVPVDAIPEKVKRAQIEASVSIGVGNNPLADISTDSQIIEEQVDVLKVKYATRGSDDPKLPSLTAVELLLECFLDVRGQKVKFVRV